MKKRKAKKRAARAVRAPFTISLGELVRVARWARPLDDGPYVGICLGGPDREVERGQVIIKGLALRMLVEAVRVMAASPLKTAAMRKALQGIKP